MQCTDSLQLPCTVHEHKSILWYVMFNKRKHFSDLQGKDFVDNKSPKTDENGHGTHVAGTVMALEYGMAPKATSIAVRVLNAAGSGSTSGIMNGISWVVEQGKRGVIK